ncbi:MAG: hypothetical protein PHR77_09680 [Kiritimatiellae bacterium]|nr:hypothetical protein [Kiritimatiellia bacterium]MDD5520894.1 hypothetical protein [Kiritimatiellia bacterium]
MTKHHPFTATLITIALALCGTSQCAVAGSTQDATSYADAIAKINRSHAQQPGRNKESDLVKLVPAAARTALKRVLQVKPSPALAPSLLQCGEAALDLDLIEDFGAIRARLVVVDPDAAVKLGKAVSRPRFIVRGIGDFQPGYLDTFADVCDGVLKAYDEVFGFTEFSKVPGKKLRFRVHLEPNITKPPHFAPEFPWHSEIDFPVADAAQFSSPSEQGHFFFYGLCHELGHVIAMWGDPKNMEDKHAWAHYTGVTIVEHLTESAKNQPWMARLRDAHWRALSLERAVPANQVPSSLASHGGVMAMLIALHDTVGPKMIGTALNRLDARNKNRRINLVRFYSFANFERELVAVAPDKRDKIAEAFGKK